MSPDDVHALLPGLGAIRTIERIKHGLTNDSWRVIADDDDIVIRRGNASEASLQIDRASESKVLQLVANAGLGPQVVLSDAARRVLITRYAGSTWTAERRRPALTPRRRQRPLRRVGGALPRI